MQPLIINNNQEASSLHAMREQRKNSTRVFQDKSKSHTQLKLKKQVLVTKRRQ